MLSKLPPLRNGQPTADWCLAVTEFLDALQTTTGGGGFRSGVTIDQTGMSFQEYDKSVFLATITGRSGSAYAWTKLVSSTGGVNGTDGYGAAGTTTLLPAYHVTGATSIANGSVVLMWPADSENEMRFVNGFDPSNLIDLSGRSGSIADVTVLQILRGVLSGTAGAAVFTPDDASETLPGIVSVGDQNIWGTKNLLTSPLYSSEVLIADVTWPVTNHIGIDYVGPSGPATNLPPQIASYTKPWDGVSVGSGDGGELYLAMDGNTLNPRLVLTSLGSGVGNQCKYAVQIGSTASSIADGATGTSGGGDAVYGGIITTLGSGPSGIDGGTF